MLHKKTFISNFSHNIFWSSFDQGIFKPWYRYIGTSWWKKRLKKLVRQVRNLRKVVLITKSQVSCKKTIPGRLSIPNSSSHFPQNAQRKPRSLCSWARWGVLNVCPDRRQTLCVQQNRLFIWRKFECGGKIRRPSAFEVSEEAGERNSVAIGDIKVT